MSNVLILSVAICQLLMVLLVALLSIRSYGFSERSQTHFLTSVARQEGALERLVEKVMSDLGVAAMHTVERQRLGNLAAPFISTGQNAAHMLPLEPPTEDSGSMSYGMPGVPVG